MCGVLAGSARFTDRLTLGYRDAVAVTDSSLHTAGRARWSVTNFIAPQSNSRATTRRPGCSAVPTEPPCAMAPCTAACTLSYLHTHPAAAPARGTPLRRGRPQHLSSPGDRERLSRRRATGRQEGRRGRRRQRRPAPAAVCCSPTVPTCTSSPGPRPRRRGDGGQPAGITLTLRDFRDGDLDGAWYAIAATDDPAVNAAVVAEAERRRIFCVRADIAREGTAVTPASFDYDGPVGGGAGRRRAPPLGGDPLGDPRGAAAAASSPLRPRRPPIPCRALSRWSAAGPVTRS